MDFFTDELASALPIMGGAPGQRAGEESLSAGLSEISNAPRPSKRQLAKPRGSGASMEPHTEVFVGATSVPPPKEESPQRLHATAQHQSQVKSFVSVGARSSGSTAATVTPTPPPQSLPSAVAPDGSQLLTRWYQLIGEMQCLMAQMQQLGIVPPQPFPSTTVPFSAVPSPVSTAPTPKNSGASLMAATTTTQPAVTVMVGHKPPASPIPPTSASAGWEECASLEEELRKGQSQGAGTSRGHRSSGGSNSADPAPFVALVEFKRQRIRRFEATLFVNPGEYVIVDGDRGTDCGFVVQCSVRNPDGTFGRTESIDATPIDATRVKAEAGKIHRVASSEEIEVLHGELASMERFALGKCRQFVGQMQLKMEIVDCEFQFDRKKVTFFFDSQEAIDFRELTKDLYRFFGTRIWLENINSKVKNVVPDGALSHADKLMYAQRGLRAPRR